MSIFKYPHAGLTLTELLIVISITAVLAAIGYPSYQTYLKETRRQDAINSIRENQLIIESYILNYAKTPSTSEVSLLSTSAKGYYTLTYNRIDETHYIITAKAEPSKSQATDTNCTVIWISSELDTTFPAECK